MEKYANWVSIMIGAAGGFLAGSLGGFDKVLEVLLFLIVVDFVTGWIKAIVTKQLSSAIGMIGIAKKVMILLVVAVAVEAEKIVGDGLPIREIVIMFYIANEGISFFENVSEFIPMPEKLKDIFIQLRSKDK
ncbi:holin [Enterococcus silesiacus]|uniref:Holin n=1 Tax=Enterococcus silesiacus TaxID=332949 RepID=A0A0S3KFR1_9ENTE|nr:phage holin family protein [Enterococcus silesiacus]ALS03107.1 holin [Enterococcus silesiacus]OJG93056.1 holin [Enterococcus silesiacus]